MAQDDEIARVLANIADPMREALDRARLDGRREALDIIKAKLSGGIFGLRLTPEGENEILGLSKSELPLDEGNARSDNVDVPSPAISSRVVPGTVRPAILGALSLSQGRRPSEVTAITNLKENTVRGTLRALGLEGTAVKRGDLWFLAETKEAPSAVVLDAS